MGTIDLYSTLLFRTIVLYFYIIFIYRLLGRKELGQLSVTDLIVTIIIAELAAVSIGKHDGSVFESIIPIFLIAMLQIGIGYATLKSSKFRNLLDGKPTVIIKNGKVMFSEMAKQRYSVEDLVMQLREQGFKSIEEVEYAVLETNGKLSVFNNSHSKTNGDYPLPVIVDSTIDYEALKSNKKNAKWINDILERENIALDDVFYAFFTKDRLFIIKKNEIA